MSLQVDRYTYIEAASVRSESVVDATVDRTVLAAHLRIGAQVLGQCEHIVGFAPDLQTQQPAVAVRNGV